MEEVERVHRCLKFPQSCGADPENDADNPFHNIGSEYKLTELIKGGASLSIHINKV